MASYQFTYQDPDSDTSRHVLVTTMQAEASAPPVYKVRTVPPTPGVRGYGLTEGEAIVDLFRAERDANRSA